MQKSSEQAINLYANSLWEAFLSKFKFWEEPYEIVDKMLPNHGKVTDLGCGEGLLSNYLALSSDKRKVIGIEIAPERLLRAKKGIKNTSFYVGDIVKKPYPKTDIAILFHVLHHLPGKNAQEEVIKKAKDSLEEKGKLIIVEVHVKPTIKYAAAWFADHFLVPWVFEKRFYTKAYFRKEQEWVNLLKQLGFKVKITHATKGRPFPNIIFECTINN
ncbi:MAG: class I SAM-dependent methyltransferase [Candidatus Levybacteria bacterium]|nr:class I SAM-dependent methyltransferase [Candidatus Levybacteria bacterium]